MACGSPSDWLKLWILCKNKDKSEPTLNRHLEIAVKTAYTDIYNRHMNRHIKRHMNRTMERQSNRCPGRLYINAGKTNRKQMDPIYYGQCSDMIIKKREANNYKIHIQKLHCK